MLLPEIAGCCQAFEPEPETVADDDVDFPEACWERTRFELLLSKTRWNLQWQVRDSEQLLIDTWLRHRGVSVVL